ncbi:hypothetical protein Tco_0852911 [Tanacetum coccineum]
MTWHTTGKCTDPGLAADGFNPFGYLSQSYSMWSMILTTYNLPPWLCMKESSFMMTLLILGPKSPGKDIDVYLRPLIDDLKDLWANLGVVATNVATGLKFNIRAMVLWTINDFPARSSLSGWSGQGYKVCPTCNEDTPSMRMLGKTAYVGHRRVLKKPHKWRRPLEFNGEIENGDPPREFSRDAIMTQLARLPTLVKSKHPRHRQGKTRHAKVGHSMWLVARPNQKWEVLEASGCFDAQELKKVKWYVLHNSPEIDTYRAQFTSLYPEKDMLEEFPDWFGKLIRQRHVNNPQDPEVSTTSELFALACGPSWTPISVNSCVVDGVRYVVHSRDERRTTQNSGICSPGPDGEMYYGQLQEILEFKYLLFKVVLFDTRNQGRKVKRLVLRNNMTQIDTRDSDDERPHRMVDDVLMLIKADMPGPTAVTVAVRIVPFHTMYPPVAWVALLTETDSLRVARDREWHTTRMLETYDTRIR